MPSRGGLILFKLFKVDKIDLNTVNLINLIFAQQQQKPSEVAGKPGRSHRRFASSFPAFQIELKSNRLGRQRNECLTERRTIRQQNYNSLYSLSRHWIIQFAKLQFQ
jgi:hypothetical protein